MSWIPVPVPGGLTALASDRDPVASIGGDQIDWGDQIDLFACPAVGEVVSAMPVASGVRGMEGSS